MMVELQSKSITIGFSGGGIVYGVDSTQNFLLFFQIIKKFINWSRCQNSNFKNLICDRLYKRYVKSDELKETTEAMLFIQEQFRNIEHIKNQKNAYAIFEDFFKAYNECSEEINYYLNKEKNVENLRIIVTSLPYASFDLHRSLEELDNWDGPPFWTRFYLKELYDQGKEIPELPF